MSWSTPLRIDKAKPLLNGEEEGRKYPRRLKKFGHDLVTSAFQGSITDCFYNTTYFIMGVVSLLTVRRSRMELSEYHYNANYIIDLLLVNGMLLLSVAIIYICMTVLYFDCGRLSSIVSLSMYALRTLIWLAAVVVEIVGCYHLVLQLIYGTFVDRDSVWYCSRQTYYMALAALCVPLGMIRCCCPPKPAERYMDGNVNGNIPQSNNNKPGTETIVV